MSKAALGTMLMVAGLLLSFIPPFLWGAPLFVIGIIMIISGAASTSVSAAKTVVAVGKEVARAQAKNTASMPKSTSNQTHLEIPAYDTAKWNTLKEFDDDIRSACEKLAGLGVRAEARLAAAYLSVQDKSLLDRMVSKIHEEETRAGVEERAAADQMKSDAVKVEEELKGRGLSVGGTINGRTYFNDGPMKYVYFDPSECRAVTVVSFSDLRNALMNFPPE